MVFARKKQYDSPSLTGEKKVYPTMVIRENINAKDNRIYSPDNISRYGSMDDIYSVEKVEDVLEIKSISPTELKLEFVEVVYTFKFFGKQERQPYLSQTERPQPNLLYSPLYLFCLLLLVIVAVLLGWLLYRRSKRGNQKIEQPDANRSKEKR